MLCNFLTVLPGEIGGFTRGRKSAHQRSSYQCVGREHSRGPGPNASYRTSMRHFVVHAMDGVLELLGLSGGGVADHRRSQSRDEVTTFCAVGAACGTSVRASSVANSIQRPCSSPDCPGTSAEGGVSPLGAVSVRAICWPGVPKRAHSLSWSPATTQIKHPGACSGGNAVR